MSGARTGRAIIIGGSLGGLFAAGCLRRIGWEVEVCEKTGDDLASRGAGLGTHDEIFAVLEHLGIEVDEDIGVPIRRRYVMERDGSCSLSLDVSQRQSSWAWFYNRLKDILPARHYHFNAQLASIEQDDRGVTAVLADGRRLQGDLLVGADGIRSTVRAQFAPRAQPRFSGYVGWRGMIPEAAFPPALHAQLFDRYVFCLPEGEMMLAYPVPGAGGDTRPGHRGYNFVWYHPVGREDALSRLCTDARGRCHGHDRAPSRWVMQAARSYPCEKTHGRDSVRKTKRANRGQQKQGQLRAGRGDCFRFGPESSNIILFVHTGRNGKAGVRWCKVAGGHQAYCKVMERA
jgi:2-polyprenyl-6-methoxyphenol hydroxylase-like FAD-dependent oxidoreductase